MLSIRLTRVGKKKAPVYRIVVMPKHTDPWALTTEILGHYNPRTKEFVAKTDRVKYWLAQGAQATDSIWNLLVDQKVIEGKKRGTSHISKTHAVKLETKAAESKKKSEDAAAKAAEAKVKEAEAKAEAAAKAKEDAAQAKADAEAAAAAEKEKPAEEPVAETTETPAEEPAA